MEFNEVLKDLQELNAEKVSSYIILVKEDTPNDDGHSSKGLNAVYGNAIELANLLANLNPRIIQKFLIIQTLREINNDK